MFEGLTTGQLCFYGGIAGAVLSVILIIVFVMVFEGKKSKMLKNIESED